MTLGNLKGRLGRWVVLGLLFCGSELWAADAVSVRLQIVDAVTEVPISGAVVSIRDEAGKLERIGESTNGVLTFPQLSGVDSIELWIEAQDYSHKGVRLFLTNKRIEMDRKIPFKGMAISPSGQAASGASVVLLSKRSMVAIGTDAKIIMAESVLGRELAARDGSFTLGVAVEPQSILVVHDLGVASVPMVGWTNGTEIQLRPWVFAKGRMLINDKPAANESLMAGNVRFAGSSSVVQLQKFEAQTDGAGNFFFDRLPQGEILLLWKIPNGPRGFSYSHGMPFIVDPTSQKSLQYHLHGRTVRGKVVTSEQKADWNADHIYAHIFTKPPPVTEFSPLGVNGPWRHYAVIVDQNGLFEAKVLPPGDYSFSVQARRRNSFQSFEGRIEVAAGDGELDLGEVLVKSGR